MTFAEWIDTPGFAEVWRRTLWLMRPGASPLEKFRFTLEASDGSLHSNLSYAASRSTMRELLNAGLEVKVKAQRAETPEGRKRRWKREREYAAVLKEATPQVREFQKQIS